MSNSLGIDLRQKVVIFEQRALTVPATEHPFLVDNGFGALPFTSGDKLSGVFLSDGERAVMPGSAVARLATDAEIRAVAPDLLPES